MYLKRLEMYGFKSFAEKTVLDFMPGITTVIGPNGSGKSNISDCIRWVLGEQSLKNIRGTKSEDVIFSGTQNRKSLGFAEASLVIDNQDGSLPIEYNEVTVSRRLYRSGESGYFINKVPCRLKDIQELFMDTGIGKDGYSIIGQGRVDQILSNKSEDRRHIFEEAAGIVKYRTRKEESEKKLEQTKVNLLRINDIISEIETNIGPLKEQSEKARAFLDLREELKKNEVGLFLYNIDDNKKKIEEAEQNIDIFETQKVKEEERSQNLTTEKDDLKFVIENLQETIEKTQELSFGGTQRKEQYNSEINVCTERITNNKDNYERLFGEIEELTKRNEELEDEKKQRDEKKEALTKNKEKFAGELKEKEEELAEYTKNLSEKELEIEAKKKIVEANIDKKYDIIAEVSTEKANLENLKKLEKTLKNDIDDTISDLDRVRNEKADSSGGFFEIDSKRNTIITALADMKKENEEVSLKIDAFNKQIETLELEYRMKKSRHDFLVETEKEKEGYSRSVKSLLESIEESPKMKKGVHGVLANLISVEKEYETAIEITLGGAIQNIVTDTEDEAKMLVKYLRDNKLGRASFLPISTVKGQKITGVNDRGISGVIGIASDLVKTDRKYEGIILNLLGKTVVVDNIDNAVELAKKNSYKFRIVTLNGDLINPSGAISGGSVAPKTVSILGRGKEIKELEKELKQIETRIEKIKEEKATYEAKVKEKMEKQEEKQLELQSIEITYATEKQKVDIFDQEIEKQETKLSKLRENLEKNKEEQQANEKNQVDLNRKVEEMEKENSELNAVIDEFTRFNKDNQKYIDDLNLDITNLKISVSSFDESESSINEIVDRINLEIKKNTESIESKTALREKIVEDNKELEAKIEEVKKEIEKLIEEIGSSAEKVEELKKEKQEKTLKLEEIEKELQEQTSKVEDINSQISKLDLRKSKVELELNQIINNMWNEYELTPNNVGEIEKTTSPKETEKRVNSLREEIRDLGPINVDSIKEYQNIKERYDFMSEQRYDLEETVSKLKKVIQEMTDTMQKQFSEQFKIINRNFGKVFKELFGGGNASLKLSDESNVLESGIEIEVEPPGKKLQNMMLLSGGERAFTAIALLFAILEMNPAPFCVLDEIEAALDDVNVYRFAEYLKKFTSKTQFLVITHRKGTMEAADTVYGITMEEKGVSKLLSMKLN